MGGILMSIECLYKDIDWCKSAFYKSDNCLCDTSIIVPDSMSDIIKIVSVKALPLITETKSVSGQIEITGQVRFNVLYISEDDKSRICSLSQTAPFSHSITNPAIGENDIVLSSADSVTPAFTLLNSRKVKLSALIKFSADTYSVTRTRVLSRADNAETLTRDVSIPSYKVICSKNIVVTSNANIPAGKGAINKILKENAQITDSDYKILNNKLVVKGNILLSVLYDGESITDCSVSVPFTEVVEAEGLTPSLNAHVHISVADSDIKPDTDLSGEFKMLDATLVLNVRILAYTIQEFPLISDIFSPGFTLSTEQSTLNALSEAGVCCEEEFLKETVSLPSPMPSLVRITDFDVTVCDMEINNTAITLTAEVFIIYITDDASSPLNTYSVKIPLTHRITSCTPNRVKASVKHTGYALISDNTIDIRIGFNFELGFSKSCELTYYTSCETTQSKSENRASILVSCVNDGDSLWSIAKKYNIPLSHLAASNALDEASTLTVGKKLIIPR